MIISFANQKGGAQKTTLTTLFATAIHYGIDAIKLAVIDADLQHSLVDTRRSELDLCKEDPFFQNKLEKQAALNGNKPLYPIIYAVESDHILKEIDILQKGGYNMILLDLPGSLEKEGLEKVYAKINFLFIPVSSDTNSLNSSNLFIHKIHEIFLSGKSSLKNDIKGMAVLFTKLTLDERLNMSKRFEEIREMYESQNIQVLKNGLIYSKVFEGDSVVSTIFPFPKSSEHSKITPYPLIMEITSFIETSLKKK